MQESSGQPHIDQYRSKLYSLYFLSDNLLLAKIIAAYASMSDDKD